jgi:hypothetical protein
VRIYHNEYIRNEFVTSQYRHMFVLRPSCVSEKLGVNENDVNKQ